MIDLSFFEPVEDKPGYYWLNRRRCEIIAKETLERAIEKLANAPEGYLLTAEEIKYLMGKTNIHVDLAKNPDQTAYYNYSMQITDSNKLSKLQE